MQEKKVISSIIFFLIIMTKDQSFPVDWCIHGYNQNEALEWW